MSLDCKFKERLEQKKEKKNEVLNSNPPKINKNFKIIQQPFSLFDLRFYF